MSVTETLAGEILSLPMYAELSDEQIAYVIATLREFIKHQSSSAPMEFAASTASVK